LQSDQATLNSQASTLGSLDADFTALQTAVQNIDTAVSGSSFEANVSDPNSVSATASDGATEGNYTVQVDNIGAYATSLSSSTWVDTPGAPRTYQLAVGAQSFNITPTDNSAASVVAAINSQHGNLVQATLVNVGSNSSPDYRIALQNQVLGDSPVDLQWNGSSLQTQQTQGALAKYEVNGSGLTVSSNTPTVTISPGLTVDLLQQTGSPVNITVTRSSTALANALSSFTTAYNTAVNDVDAERGQNAGPLQGQQIVFDLSNALSSIATYAGDSSFGGLSSVGLTLGSNGQFTFNESTLLAADLTSSSSVNSFLGSIAGGGFLQSANNTLSSVENSSTGAIKTTEAEYETQSTDMQNQITTQQQQVALLQTNLTNQMVQADSLIASMQSQYSYITSVFQAELVATQQIAHA
jgi:flagellar hook-associated protein 2